MTPEILIVGDPAGRRMLADQIAALGYAVSLCSPRELNRRVRTAEPPAAIVACMGDLDPDVLLAGLRRTRAGASIPVILYGRLGGPLRDLADVLDLGADAFLEEPASDNELRNGLSQFVRPNPAQARPTRGSRRGDDRERDRDREREREREPEPEPEEPRRRPRGEALGELHRTLDRLEASLRSDDHRSDPELSELGFDRIPDVDPPESDPLVTDVGEHLRGRVRDYEPVRGDDLGHSLDHSDSSHVRRSREREPERAKPRASREPTERLRRLDPDHDTGPGRRSWRDEPGEQSGTIGGGGSGRTRTWDRSEHEGPIRREPRPEPRDDAPPRSSRSSAVLLGRRPDRESARASETPDNPEGTSRFRDPASLTDRFDPHVDPHARDVPWPEDDFDPSESTMIRRERGSATTRRRSTGDWTPTRPVARPDDARESAWGRAAPDTSRSTTRGRPPAREPERRREAEPALAPEFTSDAPSDAGREPMDSEPTSRSRRNLRSSSTQPSPTAPTLRSPGGLRSPAALRSPATLRSPPTQRSPGGLPPTLHIDPSLRESGKLDADTDVATVLWALHEQRFTGKLRLVRARVEKQIWLHDGEAVFARSTATSDRLVDGLLRRGVLTRPQYETARRLAAKEPRRAGQLLVDAGFLKARELDVLLRDHLARVIDSTFVWADGAWSTEPGDRTDEPIQLEVPMAALILDGIRYRCDASELEDRLERRAGGRGPLVPRLRAKADELSDQLGGDDRGAIEELIDSLGETFRLLPEEESWLRRFDGRHGVAALLSDGADEQALFALLLTLDLAGCVELREQPEPVAEGSRDPAQIDGERILERLRLAREADYFELLGVARDASRSEIRQAHSELGTTFADDALEDEARRRHARELRELRAALEEARDILIDDAMRSAYLAHLGDMGDGG